LAQIRFALTVPLAGCGALVGVDFDHVPLQPQGTFRDALPTDTASPEAREETLRSTSSIFRSFTFRVGGA
jgi:hypothetical protein